MGLIHWLHWLIGEGWPTIMWINVHFPYFHLSLIKMLYWMIWNNCEAEDNHATEFYLTVSQLTLAVRRNFGGSDEFDPLCEFQDCLQSGTLMEVLMLVMCCISNLRCCSFSCFQTLVCTYPSYILNNAFCTVRLSHMLHAVISLVLWNHHMFCNNIMPFYMYVFNHHFRSFLIWITATCRMMQILK